MSLNPDVVFVSGPTYWSALRTKDLLVPFSYTNGKLDITPSSANYPGDSTGSPIPFGNAGASVRLLGGNNLVTSIGTNLQALLRTKTWGTNITIATGAPINVVSPALVTRVQQLSSDFIAPTWDLASYKVTQKAWDGSNFIGESTVYMFTKPLVLQTTRAAVPGTAAGPMCITLQSSWDH